MTEAEVCLASFPPPPHRNLCIMLGIQREFYMDIQHPPFGDVQHLHSLPTFGKCPEFSTTWKQQPASYHRRWMLKYNQLINLAPNPGTLDDVHFPTNSVMLPSQSFITYRLKYEVEIINTPFIKQQEKGSGNKK